MDQYPIRLRCTCPPDRTPGDTAVYAEQVTVADLLGSTRPHPIDRCIAPEVLWLNYHGVRTAGSCCGHGKMPGSIIVEDGQRRAMLSLGYVLVRECEGGPEFAARSLIKEDEWMDAPKTELVAIWQPGGVHSEVAFVVEDSIPDLLDSIRLWAEDDIEGPIGTITIERKPVGWVASLPDHDGW